MINFELLEINKEDYRNQFLNATPFPHIGIDQFCDAGKLEVLYNNIPEIKTKSADYVFAKNKFEKSKFQDLGNEFKELYDDLTSERFQELLKYITEEDIFIDKQFYGGGIHRGGKGSFLDMHVDFNYHPLKPNWFRNLNLLLYINKNWQKEFKGELKLEHSETGEKTEVDIHFNRLTIMQCRGYTLHGYDTINFPENQFRTSLAIYAYTYHEKPKESPRTTEWKVNKKNPLKYLLSKIWVPAVKLKNKFSKSATANN